MRTRESGFSLVELSIVTGIIAIIALSMAEILSKSSHSQMLLSQKTDSIILRNYLVDLFGNQKVCSCILNGIQVNGSDPQFNQELSQLKGDCHGTVILEKEKKLEGSTNIKVRKISFGKLQSLGSGGSPYRGLLHIELDYTDGMDRHPIEIPAVVDAPAGVSTLDADSCEGSLEQTRMFRCTSMDSNSSGSHHGPTIFVRANVCVLSSLTFDQSQSGFTNCHAEKSGKVWSLYAEHKDSPTACKWTCYGNLQNTPPSGCSVLH